MNSFISKIIKFSSETWLGAIGSVLLFTTVLPVLAGHYFDNLGYLVALGLGFIIMYYIVKGHDELRCNWKYDSTDNIGGTLILFLIAVLLQGILVVTISCNSDYKQVPIQEDSFHIERFIGNNALLMTDIKGELMIRTVSELEWNKFQLNKCQELIETEFKITTDRDWFNIDKANRIERTCR